MRSTASAATVQHPAGVTVRRNCPALLTFPARDVHPRRRSRSVPVGAIWDRSSRELNPELVITPALLIEYHLCRQNNRGRAGRRGSFAAHTAPPPEREKLWVLIEATPALVWMLLTKRPEQIRHMVLRAWLATLRLELI